MPARLGPLIAAIQNYACGMTLSFTWDYDRAETIADAVVHVLGVAFAIAGAAALIIIVVHGTSVAQFAAVTIYLAGLLAMISFSAAYNLWPVSPLKWWLRRFDHSAIYLLIAATYTAFMLPIRGTTPAVVLAIIWTTAVRGNTDSSSVGSNDWLGYYSLGAPQALDRLSNEYGLSANDATHRLAGVATVALPLGRGMQFGTNMNRVLDAFIGGWSVATTFTVQTGQPIPIGMSLPRLADGNQRPNVNCSNPGTGISYHDAAATGNPFFNVSCFADPGDQQLGNTPRRNNAP